MSATVILEANAPREQWLGTRSKGIGGSDVAALVGLSKWKSPYALWLEKTGQVPEQEIGEAAYWGTVLEPIVAGEFAKRTGHTVLDTPGTLQHPDIPYMLVNPDRLVCDTTCGTHAVYGEEVAGCDGCALLEIKTTSAYNADEWRNDSVPFAAALQCQHAFAVTGLSKAYVPALIGGQKFVLAEVHRDEELIDMLIKMEADFWRRVIEMDPPDIDGRDSTTKLISRLYKVESDKVVELPDDFNELVAQREAAKAEADAAKELADQAANRVRALLGPAEVGTVNGEVAVTWKSNVKGIRTLNFKKEAK